MPTGRTYHQYINPERAMPQEAFEVHGLGDDFLRDKPVFRDVAGAFVDFVGDARLVIHNAAFDMKFINAELGWLKLPPDPVARAVDTLAIARRRFPGAPASLDALCRRFGIDNSARTLHGALLDAEILAEVYLELIGGRQPGFVLGGLATANRKRGGEVWRPQPRPTPPAPPDHGGGGRGACAPSSPELGPDALWAKADDGSAHRLTGASCACRASKLLAVHPTKSMLSTFTGGNPPSRVTSLMMRRAKREQHARAFDHQEGVKLVLRARLRSGRRRRIPARAGTASRRPPCFSRSRHTS
jgi:DNA polymerase III subunit epsilon